MAFLHVPKVSIKGISACVPKTVLENIEYPGFHEKEVAGIIASIGIERRRFAGNHICTSDLCFHAAEKLISELKWDKSEIDCVIMVTQTPDYTLPATACILQYRLGLKSETFAMDISLGCSGWVYGLQTISGFLSNGDMRRGLLLVGETHLKFCSPEDKTTWPLFGDAGTATAVEFDDTGDGIRFHTGTDGKGYNAIIIPDGGYRNQVSPASFETLEIKPGVKRNNLQVILDGMNVFSFSITRAPESVKKLSAKFDIDMMQVDYFIFHQANLFMNERIRRNLDLPLEKVPYSLKNYGNTGPGSIPLTMVTEIGNIMRNTRLSMIACAFGVGLSWGSAYFVTDHIVCPEILEIESYV